MMPQLCQIALSVHDLRRTHDWYTGAFGLLPAGGQHVGGDAFARLLAVPRAAAQVLWLVDKQDFFQLELFRFAEPVSRTRAPGLAGYCGFSVWVEDFERTLARLVALGSAPVEPVHGEPGRRRACVRDPDGVVVEVTEDDQPARGETRAHVRPDVPAAVRRITAAVHDLGRARRFWVDTLGLLPEYTDGEESRRSTLWAGGIALELLHLGVDDRDAGLVESRIWDYGIVNLALGGPDLSAYVTACERTREAGYHHNGELRRPEVRATYLEDDQRFSVELLYRSAETAHLVGFRP